MSVFNPHIDRPALAQRLDTHTGLLVVCYCAAWCDTCTQYQQPFEALSERLGDSTFIWIDIEECPELLGDEDIENFPTILLQDHRGTLFFGAQLPHIQHLERLIQSIRDPARTTISGGPGDLRALMRTAP
ncbi:thioredoxin family protein [Alcaligenaceae bacterium CGII-47]|nr:thioredoxin family protein [Alcaligenaceae bacterium CGII-47]